MEIQNNFDARNVCLNEPNSNKKAANDKTSNVKSISLSSEEIKQGILSVEYISGRISRPISEMTEEEQLEICQRLAIIGQMSSPTVREEEKRNEEKK